MSVSTVRPVLVEGVVLAPTGARVVPAEVCQPRAPMARRWLVLPSGLLGAQAAGRGRRRDGPADASERSGAKRAGTGQRNRRNGDGR